MKVILLQDVKKIGSKGSVLEVAEGYARNFLFPRKLAVEATQGQLNDLQQKKAGEERKKAKMLDDARVLGKKIEAASIILATKVGEGGRLFGSITSKDISEALKSQSHIDVDKKKIELNNPIKSLGEFPVTIKLHPEVQATLDVKVVEE